MGVMVRLYVVGEKPPAPHPTYPMYVSVLALMKVRVWQKSVRHWGLSVGLFSNTRARGGAY